MVLALTSSSTEALTAQADEPIFVQATAGSIVERGAPGAWDRAYNDPGAIFMHGGKLHMFNNGFDGWPTTSGIGYYTSEDGLEWEARAAGPVFRAGEQTFDGFGLVATSGLVTDNGEWRLYLTQLRAAAPRGVTGVAFRVVTADDPLGDWTLDEEPILLPGEPGAWDDAQISDPMVMGIESGYVMYYSGVDRAGMRRIGLARSRDGVVWDKHAEPILEPSLKWESGVHYPSVVETSTGYAMVYRAPLQGARMSLGLAFSEDGVSWSKRATPVFEPDSIEGSSTSNITALVHHDGSTFLYVDAFVGGAFSLPYVLQHTGELDARSMGATAR